MPQRPSPVLSREQVRRIDRAAVEQLGIHSLVLMENAARGLSEVIHSVGSWSAITIVAGPGNNGGDGLALARLLAADHAPKVFSGNVRVILIRGGKSLSPDAQANFSILQRCGIPVEEPSPMSAAEIITSLPSGSILVDALLGTGVRGTVSDPFFDIITAVNLAAATRLAVDVPSGLDCDSGSPCGTAVRAQHTVTFVAAKPGLLTPHGRLYAGQLHIRHIGVPAAWIAKLCQQPDTL
ncbi:MAG: NAD(P)H-hydrate epimerase [Planctomycetota bacterium]